MVLASRQRRFKRKTARLAAYHAAALAVLSTGVGAQDLEPRQYSNIPVGLNFLVVGYARSEGGVLFDPTVQLENTSAEVNGPVFGYARALNLAGMSAKIDAGIAQVCLAGTADYLGEPASRNVCGLSDAKARLSVNFRGAPAYRLHEFSSYRQDLVVGASVAISAPIGQYDPERLVNIGTNRWALKAEIGMSKVLRRWFLELALAGTFYQDNDEFVGGVTRAQNPIASLQLHAVRTLPSGAWLSVDATYYGGGKTTTGGIENRNAQANSRFGLTLSLPVGGRQSIKLNASAGLSTRTGSDFDTLGVSWQYRWGGEAG